MYVCMYVRMSDTLLETLVMLKCNSCVNCVRFVEGRRQIGELYWMLICISALPRSVFFQNINQVLGPGLGLEELILGPGHGLEGQCLGPGHGLEGQVLVNIPVFSSSGLSHQDDALMPSCSVCLSSVCLSVHTEANDRMSCRASVALWLCMCEYHGCSVAE